MFHKLDIPFLTSTPTVILLIPIFIKIIHLLLKLKYNSKIKSVAYYLECETNVVSKRQLKYNIKDIIFHNGNDDIVLK